MEQGADPWDWGIDEVVGEFCQSRTLWRTSRPGARLPDPALFERTIRENEVDGATLLSAVGHSELRDDFQIKPLGQRDAVMWGIEQLRLQSTKYFERTRANATQQQQIIFPRSHSPTLQFASAATTPWRPYTPVLPTTRDTSVPLRVSNEQQFLSGRSPAIADSAAPVQHGPGKAVQVETANESVLSRDEPLMEEQGRKKRRRLTLDATNTISRRNPTSPGPSGPTRDKAMSGQVQLPTRSSLSGITSNRSSFLGPKRLTRDLIFFGTGSFGKPVNIDVDMMPLTEDGTPGDVEVFLAQGQSIPGRQRYVYHQLLYFLNQAREEEVEIAGSQSMAVFPYGLRGEMAPESRSIMVLKPTTSGVKVTRERASVLGAGGTSNLDAASNPSNHDWDFLDHWREAPTEELPAYGQSEADTEFEQEWESIVAEQEAEKESKQKLRGPIDREKAVDLVDEEVDEFVLKWAKQKRPLRENTAWKTWWNPKNSRERLKSARLAHENADQLNARLLKLKQSIIDEIWHSKKAVREQCRSLEETVFQREEEKFKASVWQRSEAPLRPTIEVRKRKKAPKPQDSDQDGISLNSDSDVVDEPGLFEDFIDIDSIPQIDLTTRNDSPASDDLEQLAASAEVATRNTHSDRDSVLGRQGESQTTAIASGVDARSVVEVKSEVPYQPEILPATPPQTKDVPTGLKSRVIDLTISSDDESPSKMAETANTPSRGANPENDRDGLVLQWEWEDLEEHADRKRIVIKSLRSIPEDPYASLHQFVMRGRPNELAEHIVELLAQLGKGKNNLPRLTEAGNDRLMEVLRLYGCWFNCSRRLFQNAHSSGEWGFLHQFDEANTSEMHKVAKENDGSDVREFCSFIRRIFQLHPRPIPSAVDNTEKPSGEAADLDDESTDLEEVEEVQSTPHKKRKRVITESQLGKKLRDRAIKTRKELEDRGRHFLLQTRSSDLAEVQGVVINPGKTNEQDPIYIDKHLSKDIQEHQVEGVRFMWSEVVAASSAEEDLQGCLLAHTMGLGKTMQAIALLLTIAEASVSQNEAVRSQIPESLRQSRTLIIVPAALIFNWHDEFQKWCRNTECLGTIRSIRSEMKPAQRMIALQHWYDEGGILLISYDAVRLWVLNKATKKSGPPLSDDEYEIVKKQLLEGPSLVVADEAHHLKNLNSDISQAVKGIKTKSRIALTGSPLSNNLEEYYAMINWIAPNYLGGAPEFRAHYVEPIQHGFYQESTSYERRVAMKKLKTLEHILDPKIHRREVTVLKGRLKPKVEFVIKLGLTDIQRQAYDAFIDAVQSDEVSNAKLWAWMGVLTLLCNHPSLFWEKMKAKLEGSKTPLKEPQNPLPEVAGDADFIDPEVIVMDAEIVENELQGSLESIPVGFARNIMSKLDDIFRPLQSNPYSSVFSNKIKLLLRILRLSIDVGDRVLVFSQTIPTLDFLESLFKQKDLRYIRLDGKTKMNERQDMMKRFNAGEFDIFLISTKAGGLGFNLPGANRVVIFDFSFNPTHEEQAIGRAYRLGQEKPVFVYRFISTGTSEDKIFNTAVYKIQLAYRVVEKRNTKSLAERKKEWLVKYEVGEQADLEEHKGKDINVLDKVLQTLDNVGDGYIRDIKTTETLQEESDEKLTAEEEQEVRIMVADELKRKENPEAWRTDQLRNRMEAAKNGATYQRANPSFPAVPTYGGSGIGKGSVPSAMTGQLSTQALPSATQPTPRAQFRPPSTTHRPHGLPVLTDGVKPNQAAAPKSPLPNLLPNGSAGPSVVEGGAGAQEQNGSASSNAGRSKPASRFDWLNEKLMGKKR